MKIVIMGCGRVGARLARIFDREGHDVSVVDLNASSFARLGEDFRGQTVAGTGIDEDVLKSLGIEHADIFLAVTNRDNSNFMAAQIARISFRVPRVIARIYEPDREETFHQLGLDTICPTTLISNRIYEAVSSNAEAHIPPVQLQPAATILPTPLPEAHEDEGAERAGGHLAHSLRQRFFR